MKRWLVAMSALFVGCSDCCVARGAKVKTPRGLRNIEDLTVGDEVVVVDPETFDAHVSVIVEVRASLRECGRLHFSGGSLTVTSSHPLYDVRAQQWAPAGDWLLGVREEFVGEDGPVRVTQAERFVGVEEVFDLSVAHDLHTFVADGVVVHNKPPRITGACTPGGSGQLQVFRGQPCACGPGEDSVERAGRVSCGAPSVPATCDCGFDEYSSWWRAGLGSSDAALRDGAWWTRVERAGAPAIEVEPWDEPSFELPVLEGSPNALRIEETGDGSIALLAREVPDAGSFYGVSAWLQTDGVFPGVLMLARNEQPLLSLDVERERVLLRTPDARRWVATNLPTPQWVKHQWRLELVDETTFQLRVEVAAAGNGAPIPFRAEDTGESLDDFYADGGTFSFGDAGAPRELVLGHRSANDGGTGVLRVTGVTLSAW